LDYGTGVLYSFDGGYIWAHNICSIFRKKAELKLLFAKKKKKKYFNPFEGKIAK